MSDCTEPNRDKCPRLCHDFCNKAETEKANSRCSVSEWIDLEYISNTPELTGLLYDLNLLPEQVESGSEDEHKLHVLTRYFKNK